MGSSSFLKPASLHISILFLFSKLAFLFLFLIFLLLFLLYFFFAVFFPYLEHLAQKELYKVHSKGQIDYRHTNKTVLHN